MGGPPYPPASICSAKCVASCSTPKIKLEARRDRKGSPRTYSPGTSVMPRRCTGAPRASNTPARNQPKSKPNPVAQIIVEIPASRRCSRRIGAVTQDGFQQVVEGDTVAVSVGLPPMVVGFALEVTVVVVV